MASRKRTSTTSLFISIVATCALLSLLLITRVEDMYPALQVENIDHLRSWFGVVNDSSADDNRIAVQTDAIQNRTNSTGSKPPFRILHVITSLHEFEDGYRHTTKGADRLKDVLLPNLKLGVESILKEPNWIVDVYLVLGYTLKPERQKMMVDALPKGVGLEVWNDANPLTYGFAKFNREKLWKIDRFLARQHRYVVKDKLHHYDFFSCWEDDMRITAEHIKNFLILSAELDQLKQNARPSPLTHSWDSPLTIEQLNRMLPGFIRVEVYEDDRKDEAMQTHKHLIQIDATPCCAPFFPYGTWDNKTRHENPTSHRIMLWETSIRGISVRPVQNSSLNWIGLLPSGKPSDSKAIIKSIAKHHKSYDKNPQLFAQQAGWMMTRDQIRHFHRYCKGGFLPYYDKEYWLRDGIGNSNHNVEFWSGGFHLFDKCNVKRFLSLHPDEFSRQLIFHVSNNKQRQIVKKRQVRADVLLSQLHMMIPKSSKELVSLH